MQHGIFLSHLYKESSLVGCDGSDCFLWTLLTTIGTDAVIWEVLSIFHQTSSFSRSRWGPPGLLPAGHVQNSSPERRPGDALIRCMDLWVLPRGDGGAAEQNPGADWASGKYGILSRNGGRSWDAGVIRGKEVTMWESSDRRWCRDLRFRLRRKMENRSLIFSALVSILDCVRAPMMTCRRTQRPSHIVPADV